MSLYRTSIACLCAGMALLLAGCDDNRPQSQQIGYRGVGMVQTTIPSEEAAKRAANVVPEAEPQADNDGKRMAELTDTYKNIKVLGDLSEAQFIRTMTAITAWVAPEQGCAYCHNVENMADDGLYTKVVARRMLQMTRHINADWSSHVAKTGVTCYTCHRGQNIPNYVWYQDPGPQQALGMMGNNVAKNMPARAIGLASLPYDPFTPLLSQTTSENLIRVNATSALQDGGGGKTIQETERTYALMVHMSTSLGVNCTFCHNADAFASWENSPPQRVTAWYGIRMARDINGDYISPLQPVFPAKRLGVLGDPAKVFCATCHQGVNKPLYGVSMLKDYQIELGGKPGDTANK